MNVLGQAGEQLFHEFYDGLYFSHQMIVVQHQQGDVVYLLFQHAEEPASQGFGRVEGKVTFQNFLKLVFQMGIFLEKGQQQITDEAVEIAVFGRNLIPADPGFYLGGEIDEKGGLAIAGRGGDKDQFAFDEILVQIFQQTRPTQGARVAAGHLNFGARQKVVAGGVHGIE